MENPQRKIEIEMLFYIITQIIYPVIFYLNFTYNIRYLIFDAAAGY